MVSISGFTLAPTAQPDTLSMDFVGDRWSLPPRGGSGFRVVTAKPAA